LAITAFEIEGEGMIASTCFLHAKNEGRWKEAAGTCPPPFPSGAPADMPFPLPLALTAGLATGVA
jgi:hypothetical protein